MAAFLGKRDPSCILHLALLSINFRTQLTFGRQLNQQLDELLHHNGQRTGLHVGGRMGRNSGVGWIQDFCPICCSGRYLIAMHAIMLGNSSAPHIYLQSDSILVDVEPMWLKAELKFSRRSF